MVKRSTRPPLLAVYPAAFCLLMTAGLAGSSSEQELDQLHRELTVRAPITLELAIEQGDVTVLRGHSDELLIRATLKAGAGADIPADYLQSAVVIEQNNELVRIASANDRASDKLRSELKIAYRISIPEHSRVTSSIEKGNLIVVGIDGPVSAKARTGSIQVAYVMSDVSLQTGDGDLKVEAVSGHVTAITSDGNIACSRVLAGLSAQTGEGDITLAAVGPAEAVVQHGTGRIEVGGARGSLKASTDGGGLHVKAVPHGDWKLNSTSGAIHIELPRAAGFQVNAATKDGRISVKRNDWENPSPAAKEWAQEINGGGNSIVVYSERGRILIN